MPNANNKKPDKSVTPNESELGNVPDQICNTIIGAILDRALDPGTKLPEDVLCNHFGVSRTIVRIAIHRLQYAKLIDIQRNRGCFVVVPSIDEAIDVLGARKAIEPSIVRRVGEVGTDRDMAQLASHVDLEEEAYRNNDHRAALRLSGQFHLMLAAIAKNTCIKDFLHDLICRSALVIATYSDVTGCCKAHDHRDMVERLRADDPRGAAQQMASHLDQIERDLLHVTEIQDKPSLASVLTRYTRGGRRAAKASASRFSEASQAKAL